MDDAPILDRLLRPLLPFLDPAWAEAFVNDPDLPLEWISTYSEPSVSLDLLRPVCIIRRWWERLDQPSPRHPDQRALLLRLDIPRPPLLSSAVRWWPVDVELRWLGIVASSLFVVLEHDDMGTRAQFVARLLPRTLHESGIVDEWENERGEVERHVTRGSFPPRIVPIHQEELDQIEYELREAVAEHPTLLDDDLVRVRPPDVIVQSVAYVPSRLYARHDNPQPDAPPGPATPPTSPGLPAGGFISAPPQLPNPPQPTFGLLGTLPIAEKASDAYYDECISERRVGWGRAYLLAGNGNQINDLMTTRAIVQHVERPSPVRVRLTLSPTDDPSRGAPVEVRSHLVMADSHFLVIGVPDAPNVAEPGDLQIARVRPGALAAVGHDEHRQVARLLIDALENNRSDRRFRPLWLHVHVGLEDALKILSRVRRERDTVVPSASGQTTVITPPVPAPTCPDCGHASQPGYVFCGHCGMPLERS